MYIVATELVAELDPSTYLVIDTIRELVREAVDWSQESLVSFALAVLIVIVGWYIARGAVQLLRRPVAKRFDRPSIVRTILQTVRAALVTLFLAIAASVLGFELSEILLSVTVFSAVLAVILAPIVGSFISGLFVLADQPYEIGDMIELVNEDTRGYVDDITLRYTKMFTLDNTFLVIPNSTIRERDIVNYSAEDEQTRESLSIVVTYEGDLDKARRTIERAARDVEDVVSGGPDIRVTNVRYPARPTCFIEEFGDHGVHLTLRYWVEQPYWLPRVRSEVQEKIWEAIEDIDVEIAYPHQQLVFDEHSGDLSVQLTDKEQLSPEQSPQPPEQYEDIESQD